MPKITPTVQELELAQALRDRGVILETQHWDKHKHVDIYIPTAGIYIEIDGTYHFTDPNQIIADFNRNHFSDVDKIDTIHIPNLVIKYHLQEVADAIKQVVDLRTISQNPIQ